MLFKDLGLTAELLRAVEKQGYTEATPIQEQAIPIVLAGKDLLAGAQTGTGKTAGFTLPVLQRLQQTHNEGQKRHPRVLVLWAVPAISLCGYFRRGQYQSAETKTYQRRGDRRGHPRPPARSCSAAQY